MFRKIKEAVNFKGQWLNNNNNNYFIRNFFLLIKTSVTVRSESDCKLNNVKEDKNHLKMECGIGFKGV